MIVKKLYRKIRNKWWNKKRQVYEITTVTDYVGWFLFGFIPIYLIELDKREEVDLEEKGTGSIRPGITEKYSYLMAGKNKEYGDGTK